MNALPAANSFRESGPGSSDRIIRTGTGRAWMNLRTELISPQLIEKGRIFPSNLADYVLTTNADAPEIQVEFLDYPDTRLNAYGARGIGEIGLAGVAAAITSAVYHVTGVRVRRLPIRIEDLLVA
jgi:hypothetical protein